MPSRISSPRLTVWTSTSSMPARSTRMRLPIIVTHGWPGSVIEQLKIIEPLTNPTAHGGTASDAFHVVIPDMPGYGFSGKPTDDRLGPRPHRTCVAGVNESSGVRALRGAGRRLGRPDVMAAQAPPGLIGMHTNFPGAVPLEIDKAAQSGAPAPGPASQQKKNSLTTCWYSRTKTFNTPSIWLRARKRCME